MEMGKSCYFSGEMKFMLAFKKIKIKVIKPILKLCKKLKITPNQVTFVGLLFGIFAGIALLFNEQLLSIIFLAIHLLLDGIDGALAIFDKKMSFQGGVFDNIADLISLFFFTLGVLSLKLINPLLALWFIFTYISNIVFSIIRNHFNKPYKFILRSRYEFYLVFLFFYITKINFLDYSLILFNLFLTVTFITGTIHTLRCLKHVR